MVQGQVGVREALVVRVVVELWDIAHLVEVAIPLVEVASLVEGGKLIRVGLEDKV